MPAGCAEAELPVGSKQPSIHLHTAKSCQITCCCRGASFYCLHDKEARSGGDVRLALSQRMGMHLFGREGEGGLGGGREGWGGGGVTGISSVCLTH